MCQLGFYLSKVGKDKEREGDEDEDGDPPFDDEADDEGHQERCHVLQDDRYPLRYCRLHVRGLRVEPRRDQARVVLLLVEPPHIVPQDDCTQWLL